MGSSFRSDSRSGMSDAKESDGFSGVAWDEACQSTSFHFFPFGHCGATMKQGYLSWSASIFPHCQAHIDEAPM